MNNHKRIVDHPILGPLKEGKKVTFFFDGQVYEAHDQETIAAALLANGIRKLRVHEQSGTPRGIYCNIGHCFECRVSVNGVDGIRACLTLVCQDMDVKSGQILPTPFAKGESRHG